MDAHEEQPGDDGTDAISPEGEAELFERVGPRKPREAVRAKAAGEDDDTEVREV